MDKTIGVLIFNTSINFFCAKVKKMSIFNTWMGDAVKIYSYNGRKNISGNRIREARLKLKLSQAELAAQMQVEGIIIERDSISRIEIGTRFIPDYELPVFSKVLKVPVEWLLEMNA